MKLATSTGDFDWYIASVVEQVENYKDSKFKYINLELSKSISALFNDNEEDLQTLANELQQAADYAGVKYVVAHAPCLHFARMEVFDNPNDEIYQSTVRAIRRSIKLCHLLGIKRIVVHACISLECDFTKEMFYRYNKKFYSEFFDLMEKYDIFVMTENWDSTYPLFATGKQISDFLTDVGHPLLAACWDTAHGNIDQTSREIGQYQNIIDIGERLKGVHIADNFGDCHHHTWPFAGIINFDSVMQGLLDVKYDGYFTFEAAYTLLHQKNMPHQRQSWAYQGKTVDKLLSPSLDLKKKGIDLLYETGKHILSMYDGFEL